jgi:dipeptidyl aminopeptidase/acylaminoacyl peptidase
MVWWIILGAVAFLVITFFVMLYVMYRIAFYSPHKNQNDFKSVPLGSGFSQFKEKTYAHIDDLLSREFEAVTTTSFDGLTLYGRYYHMKDGAPVYLGFNGYRGTAIRDLCGAAMISKITGQNLLIVSQRAHGESQGHIISFGDKERYDCLSWVEFCKQKFGADVKICLNGVSMGASTVLLASGLNISENVFAIVADCPYSSADIIIKKVLGDMKLPIKVFYPLLCLAGKIYGRFNLKGIDVVDAVKKSKTPILLIHGACDTRVPVSMSEEIACANPLVERHVFPDAEHGMSYMSDEQRYLKTVNEFIERALNKRQEKENDV